MHRGAYNEDVALQPRPAREFASKLFIPKKHDTDLFQIIQSVKMPFVQKRIWISRRISQRISIWWKLKMESGIYDCVDFIMYCNFNDWHTLFNGVI